MADIYKIEDLRILKMYATREGYTLRGYMKKGRQLNLNFDQMVDASRKDKTLDQYVVDIKHKSRWRKGIASVGASVAALFLAFAANNYMRQNQADTETYWAAASSYMSENDKTICMDLDHQLVCKDKADL